MIVRIRKFRDATTCVKPGPGAAGVWTDVNGDLKWSLSGTGITFQTFAVFLISRQSGLIAVELAEVGFELLLDLGNVLGKRGDFLRQPGALVIENLQTNRVLNIRDHRQSV